MQMTKLITALLVAVLLAAPAGNLSAQAFDTTAGAAILVEASTGQVLYEKNADEPRPPASITKVMTLLLAFEALKRGDIEWDETTVVSERAWRMGGSKMFLPINEEVSIGDLIKGISIVSANDGCIALAEHLSGSEETFVQQMNRRAQELGLANTTFRNSTGIPAEGHVMSARDIARLARFLIQNHPEILEIEAQRDFTFNNIWQQNRNPLLGRLPGADGLKTGWTPESGYSLVGTAKQDGLRLISVVLNTESEEERLTASLELLNYGFRNFRLHTIAVPGDMVGMVTVPQGRQVTAGVTVKEEITVVIPADRQPGNLELVINGRELAAPVTAGEAAGTLEVRLDGRVLTTAEVVVAEDVPRAGIITRILRAMRQFIVNLLAKGR